MRRQTIDVFAPRHPRSPRLTALAILLWAALPVLAAATAAAATPPRFYLEDVAVEGVRRASPEVIVSESRLEAGIAFTEDELRQAVYRVRRLPFVLDADFALRRGSERGRYSLLISVEEVRSFFFGADLTYSARANQSLADAIPDDGPNDALTAGARLFAGQGQVFAAVGGAGELQVGYERYQLLDRPIWLRLAYAREGCCAEVLRGLGLEPAVAWWITDDESDRLELTVGVPLAGNHSLRVDASRLETDSATRRPLGGTAPVSFRDVAHNELELAWVYDTTDDPVFPSRGDALTAAVGLSWLEADLPPSPASDNPATAAAPAAAAPAAGSSRRAELSAFGARHWPLSARQTLSLSLKLVASRSEIENLPVDDTRAESSETAGGGGVLAFGNGDVDAFEAELGARYSLALWGPAKMRRSGELRWETVAGLIYLDTSPAFSPGAHPLWGVSVSTGLALRNTWGIFRIGFTFLDFDGEL